MTILIPAYEPTGKMLSLICDLKEACTHDILIVDDGSGKKYRPIFDVAEKLGCTVLRHLDNCGKGAALKTGFRHLIRTEEKEGVVCVDCDGQHTVKDICRVARETTRSGRTAVLGSRQFVGKVPLRSRFGNSMTRGVFALIARYRIGDTQTGLRGYPARMLPFLCGVEGDRFEYEMNILLKLKPEGYSLTEIPIETVYENGNRGTHFRAVADSVRVYLPFLKFSASSLFSAFADFVLLMALQAATGNLLLSVMLSRALSSVTNFLLNNYLIFHRGHYAMWRTSAKYFALVAAILPLNYGVLSILTALGIPLVAAKVITEVGLFFFSYSLQKKAVFKKEMKEKPVCS